MRPTGQLFRLHLQHTRSLFPEASRALLTCHRSPLSATPAVFSEGNRPLHTLGRQSLAAHYTHVRKMATAAVNEVKPVQAKDIDLSDPRWDRLGVRMNRRSCQTFAWLRPCIVA